MEDKEKIEKLVYIALGHGIISRGKACEYLEINRADLDMWIKDYEEKRKTIVNSVSDKVA